MLSASLYIIRCTARNRLRVRLRRLREPRYLIGAIVGALYLYFSVFARLRTRQSSAARRRARGRPPIELGTAALSTIGPALGGLALLVVTALGWLLPVDSGLLQFSEAETQFLFPAPVSRRALLVHRMLRSQAGILFGSVITSLVMPSSSGYARLRLAIGMWLLLSTGKIYFTGISLARARLGAHDRAVRRVAWLPVGVLAAAIAIVGVALTRAIGASPVNGAGDAIDRIVRTASTGVPGIVMWPFRALVTPMFAPWPGPYLIGLLSSIAVLTGSVLWVLRSDEAFQDAAEEAAVRQANEQASRSTAGYRARSAGFDLAPAGRPEFVFAWKAATQTFRIVDWRTVLRVLAIVLALGAAAASMGRRNGLAGAVAMFSLAGAAFAIMVGPQAIRIDMRQDLQHLELLKTWPVSSAAVVRGQLLWPGVLITALCWFCVVSLMTFAPAILPRVDVASRLGIGAAILIAAPALAFAQLAIHNGAALMFPAWIPLGTQRPRGLDAMGQRIIMLGGTWLALFTMALPGLLAGAVVWFAFRSFVGSLAFVPAAFAGSLVLFAEVAVLIELLGLAYERLDLLAVERSEQ